MILILARAGSESGAGVRRMGVRRMPQTGEVTMRYLALGCAFCVCAHAAGQENLIVNGSFECSALNPGNGFIRLAVGDVTSVPPWEVVTQTVDYIGPGYWDPSEGSRSFDLDGAVNHNGGLRQSFATEPGVLYNGSFDLAGNLHVGPTIKTMTLTIEGASVLLDVDYEFDVTGFDRFNDMGWTPKDFEFVADSEVTTITLQSTTQPAGWGAAVDNVIVGRADGKKVCVPDCDGNGNLNILDFVCFQGLFSSGDPKADVNGDCVLNILDFVAFQGAFVAGCP